MAREVYFSFFFGTSIFLLIMLMFQAIRLSEFVIVHQVGLWSVLKISYYLMLSFLPIAVPVSFLFAVLMGISRANSDGEILAFQVNGISLKQLFLPIGAFSILVSFFCLYTALYTVPNGNRGFELMIERLGNERVMAALKPGVFMEGFYGLMLFSEKIIPVSRKMEKVFIYDQRDEEHPLVITANAGIMRPMSESSGMTLRLTDGSMYIEKERPDGIQQHIKFEVYDINLDPGPSRGGWRDYSPPSLTLPLLRKRMELAKSNPPEYRKLQVELHRRISMSFACVVFAVLGFFIGIKSARGIRSTAIVLCMGVGVIYWISYLVANALAISGVVWPWLGIWAPNVVFMAIPIIFFKRYSWGG